MQKSEKSDKKVSFSEQHPKISSILIFFLGLTIIIVLLMIIVCCCKSIGKGIISGADWLTRAVSKMDAVIIVALITGTVSLLSVVINSIVGKCIEYNKARQEYLAKKREEPYADFIDMVYRIQQSNGSYNEEDMVNDISRFSKNITLWGSPRVVKKWVKFRENGANPKAAIENVLLVEDIMNEMRRDLGLRKVKKGDLLAFFINDIKKIIK